MQTIHEIIESLNRQTEKPDEGELRQLPYLEAYIYGRFSTLKQVRDSRESVREIALLVDLAVKDGYKTALDSHDIETKLDLASGGGVVDKTWSDGEVTVDVQDFGISGQVSFEDRAGLAELQRRVKEGTVGAVYLTEGVSRLSRDRDRILPYQLLKLLKEYKCRIRTPEGVWNPAIERDWDYLAEEFEDAIGELRVMNRRMYRRKVQKASRGEYVGEPIPPGFILPVIGQKPSGEYEYGKMEPYPPHAEIVTRILEEFINQDGGYLKTLRALGDLTIPFFPEELKYMERLTSLRPCVRKVTGYRITWTLIHGLITNLKLIGVWQWGNTEPILDNHKPVVPEGLFLEAYQLATKAGKPKGKAANFEPMEWSGLLQCMNHPEPRGIGSLNSKERYVCNRGYFQEGESVCLDITGRFLNEPLTATVLRQLDLTPLTEELLSRMESDSDNRRLEEVQRKQQTVHIEKEVEKWQALLPSCVDEHTGNVDREREEFYWTRIKESQKQIQEIKARLAPAQPQVIDYTGVRDFLKDLSKHWYSYSPSLRNRLLKRIITHVEIRGYYDIEATIIWKNGFRQKVMIHRPPSTSKLDRRWTKEEDELLQAMYPSSSESALIAALPGRSWKGMSLRARRLKLKRNREPNKWRPWNQADDEKLKPYNRKGMNLEEIGEELGRSLASITSRIQTKGYHQSASNKRRQSVSWEVSDLIPLQESSWRGGYRGRGR